MGLVQQREEVNPDWNILDDYDDLVKGVVITHSEEALKIELSFKASIDLPQKVLDDHGQTGEILAETITNLLMERIEFDLALDWMPTIRDKIIKALKLVN